MRKVSVLLMSVALAFSAYAQSVVKKANNSLSGESATVNTFSLKNTMPIAHSANNNTGTLAAAGDTIKYYDFNSNTGLTLTGNSTRGWSLGSNNSWWSNQGINSTSGADWACLKPGDPRTGALSAASFSMTTSAINCSGIVSVIMSFEQSYARFEDTAEVQISIDGTNFTTVFDNMSLPITSNSGSNPTPNPNKITVNISDIASNQATVYVRFLWTSRQQVQPGIGYGWWIDDLLLFEGEDNDMVIGNAYWKPFTDTTYIHYSDFYTLIPKVQARAYTFGFGANFSNLGSVTQENAGYDVNITGPNGYSQSGSATIPLLAPLAFDSASTASIFTLSGGTGIYNVNLTATSDSTLSLLGDDSISASVEVTENVYARDNGDIAAASGFYYNPGAIWEYEIGVIFEVETLDTIRGVSWLNLEPNTIRAGKTGQYSVHVYSVGDYTQNSLTGVGTAPLFSSSTISIGNVKDSVDQWVYTPVTSTTGGLDTIGPGNYVVTLRANQNFGTDTIFWPVQNTDFVNSQYLVRVAQSGAAMGNWSFGGRKYMIRMITAEAQCPNLVGAVVNGKASTGCGLSDGEVEVTSDPTNGKAPYTYRWDINGSINTSKKVTGLPAGSYDVTIVDAESCEVTTSASVNDFGAPTVALNAPNSTLNTTCFGDGQGIVEVNITPGSNPNPSYSYKWFENSNSSVTLPGNAVISNLEAGDYTLELNDGSTPPCIQTFSVTITGPTQGIVANASSVVNNDCKGGSIGGFEMTTTGGTGALTIVWDDASTNLKRTGLAQGIYSYTVTDANNCTLKGSQAITEPSSPFSILSPEYNGNITVATSGIVDSVDNSYADLEVKTSGGVSSNIGSVEWKNPKGDVIVGETKATLKVGANEKNDRNGAGNYSAIATSDLGCISESVVFKVFDNEELFPLAISELGENTVLNIFPNPSKGLFNIELSNTTSAVYQISIKNVIGQMIYNESFESTGSINTVIELDETVSGVYFINISNGVNEVSRKIIVE